MSKLSEMCVREYFSSSELSIVSLLIETAYDLPMSWSTIKPQDLIDLVSEFADLGSLKSSFESVSEPYTFSHN